jgi:1-aminocyclopropane-1-carboxylate deaminase/D-cysteine desulfhydrase-like pyridoxal-dependent ACC family enzyme
MAGKKQAQAWQNRIVGEGVERPDQLLANPSNWRIHPKHQQDALSAVLDNVGWVQRVIINRTTGHIVDGHLRVSLAISRNEAEVPVVYVDLTEDEELTVLATIDPLSAMAATDSAKLAELLASVQTDDAALEAVLRGVGETAGLIDGLNVALPDDKPARPSLADRFIVPPFSVLDARQGYWQERKRQWLGVGIQSEIGRGSENLSMSHPYTTENRDFYTQKTKLETELGRELTSADAVALLRERGLALASQREANTQRIKGKLPAAIGGQPLPLDRMANGRSPARTFAQDLMRGEHTVGALSGAAHGSTPPHGATVTQAADGTQEYRPSNGTSIFDPVLCELAYRWFTPDGAAILDPFAGGSVRGIVAAMLGKRYTGIDLRAEQIAANEAQAGVIIGGDTPEPDTAPAVTDPDALTPVEYRRGVWVKRDDLFEINGVRGGKARATLALSQGAPGVVSCGSRISPQLERAAYVAQALGIPCHIHTASGALTPELKNAQAAGAELFQHKPGYLTVVNKRAADDAAALGWLNIPYGAVSSVTADVTRKQVANLPADAQRIVITAGSGISLAGVLWGMDDAGLRIPVIGVQVGGSVESVLDEYAPSDWRDTVTLVDTGTPYETPAAVTTWAGIALDPHYEAKCIPFLQEGDVFWIIAARKSVTRRATSAASGGIAPRWVVGDSQHVGTLAPAEYDFVFSCPPYFDLEIYSDDPADLSNMTYEQFADVYRRIIAEACAMLKPDRFACFVVGDVRDKRGNYRDFPGLTIEAFQAAGLSLYNEAILVTSVGSLPIRVGKQMEAGRKLGKTHQNVLVFVKGDGKKAAQACGAIEFHFPAEMTEAADG